jgi:hypothetical protein
MTAAVFLILNLRVVDEGMSSAPEQHNLIVSGQGPRDESETVEHSEGQQAPEASNAGDESTFRTLMGQNGDRSFADMAQPGEQNVQETQEERPTEHANLAQGSKEDLPPPYADAGRYKSKGRDWSEDWSEDWSQDEEKYQLVLTKKQKQRKKK